jgi:hypothetical protein
MNYSGKHSHEEGKTESSLIFRTGTDKKLLLNKHINLIFSYEDALPVTQGKYLLMLSLF